MTGTTYYGDTNFLSAFTHFSAYQTFGLYGSLILTPTIDPYNASNNGVNPHDVAINTGNIGLGGAGVLEYATNTYLHQYFGGNESQAAAVDVANVSEDDGAGTMTVNPDSNTARISQLNVMYVSDGLLSTGYQIIAGQIDLQFSNGGTEVSGTLTLYGEGFIEAGTVAIQASFSGSLQG
jgi:hypothetical protein